MVQCHPVLFVSPVSKAGFMNKWTHCTYLLMENNSDGVLLRSEVSMFMTSPMFLLSTVRHNVQVTRPLSDADPRCDNWYRRDNAEISGAISRGHVPWLEWGKHENMVTDGALCQCFAWAEIHNIEKITNTTHSASSKDRKYYKQSNYLSWQPHYKALVNLFVLRIYVLM